MISEAPFNFLVQTTLHSLKCSRGCGFLKQTLCVIKIDNSDEVICALYGVQYYKRMSTQEFIGDLAQKKKK
jgi:hypothetical protein